VVTVENEVENEPVPLRVAVKNLEIELIQKALDSARYNQKRAAENMGLTYDQLRGLIRKYGKDLRRDE